MHLPAVSKWYGSWVLNRVVIRVYDAAGNVIETDEHKGEFKEW
jgi:hypothetical protein